MHPNDRKKLAENLGLSLIEFDRLIASANYAHGLFSALGPFYGKEEIKEPTFRITAEPVALPKKIRDLMIEVGNDLVYLGKALQKLPRDYKNQLGKSLDFNIPPTWRVDAILAENGRIKINELEIVDSASALMMAEQLAYNLQANEESTAVYLNSTLKVLCQKNDDSFVKLALLRSNLSTNPHTPNAKRFIEILSKLAKENLEIDLMDVEDVIHGRVKPKWNEYDGIINETLISKQLLINLGIAENRIISSGNYNALGNKGIFVLIYEELLVDFWEKELGKERLNRLRDIMIPSQFIIDNKQLEEARVKGKVVKVTWAEDMVLLNRSKGVAMPEGDMEQSDNERWQLLAKLLKQGVKMIEQEYIRPAKIKAFLRKKSTNLEQVDWYNRICFKYVCQGNPNLEPLPKVILTATEVTLGPKVIPSSRECAFTAAKFV